MHIPATVCALILLTWIPSHSMAEAVILPLRDQWRAATRALIRGDAATAVSLLDAFDQWYGDETATRNPEFREKYLRLWGLACLDAGQLQQGIQLLEKWVTTFPDQTPFRAYVRFQLASAHRALSNTEAAIRHWSVFLDEHPELPEAALVHWLWADAEIGRSNLSAGRQQLEAVLHVKQLPPQGKALAAAALALVDLAEGNPSLAHQRLSNADSIQVIDLWRALMAPALTVGFLQSNRPGLAVSTSQWFLPISDVVELAQQITGGYRPDNRGVRRRIWQGHWHAQLLRLEKQASASLENSCKLEDLYRLRLKSLLRAAHFEQARILAGVILQSSSATARCLRSDAYAMAIEASIELEDWKTAEALTGEFLQQYPQDPGLPEILFLQARTAAARKDGGTAIRMSQQLVQSYPEHGFARRWEMTAAGWLLEFGRPREALEAYERLEESSPESWQQLLKFQQARCREKLREIADAILAYREVATSAKGTDLGEQSMVALLKIHLEALDGSAFQTAIHQYQAGYPDGRARQLVAMLNGAFLESTGQPESALVVYREMMEEGASMQDAARQAVSRLLALIGNKEPLRQHAFNWIRSCLAEDSTVPEQPFLDCLHYQRAHLAPALPVSMVKSLLEVLDAGNARLPGCAFLNVLADQWNQYRQVLSDAPGSFDDWSGQCARTHHLDQNWRAYAAHMIHAAMRLESNGRKDSADSRRIRLLTHVDPVHLDDAALMSVAMTADAYDFPESLELLEASLKRGKNRPELPLVIHRLSRRLRRSGERARSYGLMESIRTDWPDARNYADIVLELAEWRLLDGELKGAESALSCLLQLTGMPPQSTARALLIRAKVDSASGNRERCLLNCQRILSLYPAFEDICQASRELMKGWEDA